MNPGDTLAQALILLSQRRAQRRPGHEPRRHTSERTLLEAIATALNEGRGMNPGDTGELKGVIAALYNAQRRPGHEPRRHVGRGAVNEAVRHRSTKAGA